MNEVPNFKLKYIRPQSVAANILQLLSPYVRLCFTISRCFLIAPTSGYSRWDKFRQQRTTQDFGAEAIDARHKFHIKDSGLRC